jgi:hypothetical protein
MGGPFGTIEKRAASKRLKSILSAAIMRTKTMPPIIIRTPFADAERTAEVLGVSPERTRELILLAERALEENPELRSLRDEKTNAKKKPASRRGKRKR